MSATVRYVRALNPWAHRKAEEFRYKLAHAAAWDAGTANMRKHGRTQWDQDDWNAMCAEFNRLMPEREREMKTETVAKSTPGPWTADHTDNGEHIVYGHGRRVAGCGVSENAEANARLIAAAPRILEALERLVNARDQELAFVVNPKLWDEARAVLREAKGGTP